MSESTEMQRHRIMMALIEWIKTCETVDEMPFVKDDGNPSSLFVQALTARDIASGKLRQVGGEYLQRLSVDASECLGPHSEPMTPENITFQEMMDKQYSGKRVRNIMDLPRSYASRRPVPQQHQLDGAPDANGDYTDFGVEMDGSKQDRLKRT